ncbi:T9SS type A sorting domain-containing protein [Winogradskyella schleiferi]|uniref:T9SS type A sorting domain-containing protein n=1 Tax=Winogradskyella schleiferi TaxID=2686078 RepID=UPI0015C1C277|nr:T9SS type A sorting domain-containing protein [Winogradskyella schleiferi]
MKKFTFLFMLLAITLGYSQSPTDNATDPPARNAGDVISIFSGEYTNIAGSDFNPNWGQSGFGVANPSFDPGTGNLVLAYPNFNYQGVQFGSAQNISGMEFLHVDIWVNGTFNPNVYVISSGAEIAHPITNTGAESWISVDIPVSGITGDTNSAIQFKFDNGNGTTDGIYVDNLYFWKSPVDPLTDATLSDLQIDGTTIMGFGASTTNYTYEVASGTTVVPEITTATTSNSNASAVITQATGIPGTATVVVTAEDGTTTETYTVSIVATGPSTAAPTPPNRTPQNVISIFSDAYTDIAVDTYDTPWCPGTTSEIMIAGDAIKQISGLGCEGIEFVTGRFDASGFDFFHMDIFTESDTMDKSFNIKFSDWQGGTGEVGALEYSATNANILPATNPGTWISIELPLSAFNVINGVDGSDLVQFVITSDLGTVYYDNLYLHNNNLSTEEFASTNFKVYPNPTQTNWNIESNTTITSISVYDILGKRVSTLTPNTNDIEISTENMQSGIYFARIEGANGSKTVKLIKE